MINKEDIFSINNQEEFNDCALQIFNYQVNYNQVYKQYVTHLGIDIHEINHYTKIPFLPIEFFKTQQVYTNPGTPSITFTSSGTTGMINSQHHVYDLDWYESSFRKAFEKFYGPVENIAILALLPSYLEREGSSLIYMVDDLINRSKINESNYFLYNHQELYDVLMKLKADKTKTILIGVTYALLDFIEKYHIDFPELIVMETGGMKGKRKEMIREE